MCCCVLQGVAVSCIVPQERPFAVLQCVAVRCSELQCVGVLQCGVVCFAECCVVLQGVAVFCILPQEGPFAALQRVAACCSVLQRVAVRCSIL